jgi:hypothetical protein
MSCLKGALIGLASTQKSSLETVYELIELNFCYFLSLAVKAVFSTLTTANHVGGKAGNSRNVHYLLKADYINRVSQRFR